MVAARRTWTVAQVAQAARVSEAAVRAKLADGTLRGERVLVGNRQVWQVDAQAADEYVRGRGDGAGSATVSAPLTAQEPPPARVAELVAENARLREALAAVRAAHQAMLDALAPSQGAR